MTDADGLDVVLAAYGYGLEEGPPHGDDGSDEEVRPVMVELTARHWAQSHGRLLGLGGYKLTIGEAGDGTTHR